MSLLFVVGPLFQSLSSLILQDQLNSAPHHPSHCSAASTCKLYARPTLQTEHLILSTVSGEKLHQRSQYSSIKPQRDCQNCLDYANKISLCCPQYRTLELFKHAQSPSTVETWQLIKLCFGMVSCKWHPNLQVEKVWCPHQHSLHLVDCSLLSAFTQETIGNRFQQLDSSHHMIIRTFSYKIQETKILVCTNWE